MCQPATADLVHPPSARANYALGGHLPSRPPLPASRLGNFFAYQLRQIFSDSGLYPTIRCGCSVTERTHWATAPMNIDKRVNVPQSGRAPYVRIVQLDVLRGFALLGIYWVNVFIFALPVGLGPMPAELHDGSGLNTLVSLFSDVMVEGTMRGLFSILFGASALLFLDEARLATSGLDLVDRYYRRTLLLLLFGVVHAYVLLWPYDVLYAYGLLGLFLFPLRKLPAGALLALSLVLLIIGDFDLQELQFDGGFDRSAITADIADYDEDVPPANDRLNASSVAADPAQRQAATETQPSASNRAEGDKTDEAISTTFFADAEIKTYRSDYLTIFTHQVPIVIDKQSNAMYLDLVYDIGGMMLLGMALFKLGVLSGQLARHSYLLIALLGYGLGTVMRLAAAYQQLEFGNTVLDVLLDYSPTYNLSRAVMTMGHIGLVGLLCYSRWFKTVTDTLAAVGRMALTNYIMQTVLSIFLFYGFGLSLFARFERHELVFFCVGVWIVQIAFSKFWLTWFKQGPLEWVWRSLIYGEAQSNRRLKQTA